MSTKIQQQLPEPIPLRSLILLCNYERLMTYPWLGKGAELLFKSHTDVGSASKDELKYELCLLGFDATGSSAVISPSHIDKLADEIPSSIAQMRAYLWKHEAPLVPNQPLQRPIAKVSKDFLPKEGASPLSDRELEIIFHETRGFGSCSFSIRIFKLVTTLCPPNQQFSIQLTNENPSLADINRFQAVHCAGFRPKILTISQCIQPQYGGDNPPLQPIPRMLSLLKYGAETPQVHWVFLISDLKSREIVVDMSRLAYGEAGLGAYNETYFMGPLQQFLAMSHNLCENGYKLGVRYPQPHEWRAAPDWEQVNSTENGVGTDVDLWLWECAQRVMNRWQKRREEPWCEYCGAGVAADGGSLFRCDCSHQFSWYCCMDHQISGWELHKYHCTERQEVERQEAARQEAAKLSLPGPDALRKDVPRSYAFGQDVPRQDTPRQDTTGQEASGQEALRSDLPRPDRPREDVPRSYALGQDVPRQDALRQEAPRLDLPRPDWPREDVPRSYAPGQDVPRQDALRQEAPRLDLPRPDWPREDVPRSYAPGQDVPRQEVPRQETPRLDWPRPDRPREDVPRSYALGQDVLRQDTPR